MNITEVRITKSENTGNLKAYATMTLEGVFVVHGLRVVEGQNGLFVAMPSRKTTNKGFKDVAHPINKEFKEVVDAAVFAEYNKLA